MNQTEKRVSYRRISERRRIRRAGKMIRRYAVSALLLAVITASIVISGAFSVRAEETRSDSSVNCGDVRQVQKYYTSVKVEEGMTLNDIEQMFNSFDMSTEEYINCIRSMNSLQSDRIHPGCWIAVVYTK